MANPKVFLLTLVAFSALVFAGNSNPPACAFVNPLPEDVLRAGDVYTVTVSGTCTVLEWGYGQNPSQWYPISSNQWNTQGLGTGYYSLRASDPTTGLTAVQIWVYLDSSLKQGWPARILPPVETFHYAIDYYRTPVVGDINGDGANEVLVIDNRIYPEDGPQNVRAFAHDGTQLWTWPFPKYSLWNNENVVLSDLNNDGAKEILVPIYALPAGAAPGDPYDTYIYALNGQGQLYSGWSQNPVVLPRLLQGRMIISVADLDNNGNNEIIIYPKELEPSSGSMFVLNSNGQLISTIALPAYQGVYHTTAEIPIAVGNFDNDPELEIVLAYTYGLTINDCLARLDVYNIDGSEVPNFPVTYTNYEAFSGPVVADINGDGMDEIVMGLSGEHTVGSCGSVPAAQVAVLDRNAQSLPGWPRPIAFNNRLSTPVVVPNGGNGQPSIIIASEWASAYDSAVYAFDKNGNALPGWPKNGISGFFNHFDLAAGDIAGNGQTDIFLGVDHNIGGWNDGRVYGWNIRGQDLPGFPKLTESGVLGALRVSDIDGDGYADVVATSWRDSANYWKGRSSVYVWGG